LFREMHRERGLTSVIATHNPRLAASCDRILRLEAGRLVPCLTLILRPRTADKLVCRIIEAWPAA
jgi:ABC-type lipoprotein export system ATPase subunit